MKQTRLRKNKKTAKPKRGKRFSKRRIRNRRTFRYKMKGGFTTAQMKGAIAVAGLLKSRKIVLLPKPGTSSQRYEISLDESYKYDPKYGKRDSRVTLNLGPNTNVNIKNFDVFVETTAGSLMKIDGNDAAVNRLAKLTDEIMNNATDIINIAANNNLLSGGGASRALALLPESMNELSKEDVELPVTGSSALTVSQSPSPSVASASPSPSVASASPSPSPNAETPTDTPYSSAVKNSVLLTGLFFTAHHFFPISSTVGLIAVSFYYFGNPRGPRVAGPSVAGPSVALSETNRSVDPSVALSETNRSDSASAASPATTEAVSNLVEELNKELDKLVVYQDPGGNTSPTVEIKSYICKTPYKRSNTNKNDRVNSCVKGVPKTGERQFNNRTDCIESCNE